MSPLVYACVEFASSGSACAQIYASSLASPGRTHKVLRQGVPTLMFFCAYWVAPVIFLLMGAAARMRGASAYSGRPSHLPQGASKPPCAG